MLKVHLDFLLLGCLQPAKFLQLSWRDYMWAICFLSGLLLYFLFNIKIF